MQYVVNIKVKGVSGLDTVFVEAVNEFGTLLDTIYIEVLPDFKNEGSKLNPNITPDPNTSILHFTFSLASPVHIYNLQGSLVFSGKLSSLEQLKSAIPQKGIYLLHQGAQTYPLVNP